MTTWSRWAESHTRRLRDADRLRTCLTFESDGSSALIDGRKVVSFAGNDYLGLAHHPDVVAAAHEALDRFGTGAGASRLVSGTCPAHIQLEEELARAKNVERALVFPTGYAANVGALTAFATDGAVVFSDQLNHASIIDGCRLAKARTEIYRHGDVDHLQTLLEGVRARKIIVTESVFSMDGDCAPLARIAELARRHDALLIVDEAHGVFPEHNAFDGDGVEVLRIGTLSKSLGSQGGWAGGSRSAIEWLTNAARTFIFTTALAPACAAAALASLRIAQSDEGAWRRARLRTLIRQLRPLHETPIVPIILGRDAEAIRVADALLKRGLYAPAIRPPTVAPGTARLRISLSAAHDDAAVAKLKVALDELEVDL